MIQVNHITKAYSKKQVLQNVTLNIPNNKITTIIGPNGAGKSTLLGIIARLLTHQTGQIIIDNIQLNDWNSLDLAKKLSILKQSNSTNIKITIFEIVSFGRYPHTKGKLTKQDHQKIIEALQFVDLYDIKDKYIYQLSGGQKQRAFIAALLAQDTDYIMLDEPLNNLDMKYMVETMQLLRKLVDQKNKTIVLVLHDINFAASYSDYLIALKDGRLVREGGVDEIVSSKLLKEIYDIEFEIIQKNNKPMCLYY